MNSDKEFSLKYVLARLGVDFNDIRKIARNDGAKVLRSTTLKFRMIT